jgi:MFS family permease
MNYRHAFHAGNHTEVFKHSVLVLLLQHLLKKPQPFIVLDTHAGANTRGAGRSRNEDRLFGALEPKGATIVGITLFFLQQLSGINAVIYYAPEIFAHAGFDSGKVQTLATVGVGTVNFVTTILVMYLIDTLGRRPLLVLGFVGTAATCSRSRSRCSIRRWCRYGSSSWHCSFT